MAAMFQSKRLIYRAVEESDEQLFLQLSLDREAYQNSNYTTTNLAGKTEAAHYRKACAEESLVGAIPCILQTDGTQIPIGEIHLSGLGKGKEHHRHTELGLQILPEFQGKGYGTEAILWSLRYAFHYSGLHRVGIKAWEWNVGALKLYEKCGFKVEGREREAGWHDGRFWDLITLGLLEDEWRAMQK